jgi:hypothetical protein
MTSQTKPPSATPKRPIKTPKPQRYKKPGIPRSVYRNDVMLQMTSKALGDEYNRATKPPKKVRGRGAESSRVVWFPRTSN